jgi:N,N'-diacetyllegionaminate synthase
MRIQLGERSVGDEQPCYLIAAIGSNHDGRLERALTLVDLAAAAGADAVRFQVFRAATLLARRWPRADGGWRSAEGFPQLERLAVPNAWLPLLRDRARARGVTFLATPFDESRATLLAALGVPGFKVASGDLTHVPLLRRLASYGRPIVLSTGLATPDEIDTAIQTIANAAAVPARRPPIVLLHCVSLMPLPPGDANLRALGTMRLRHGCLVGWSDHSPGHTLALGAVALGAAVVEKHFTDDPYRAGPDHPGAMDPDAFREMVAAVRELEAGLGDGHKRPRPNEDHERRWIRRSVYAARPIAAGAVIEAADLKVVRPGLGMPPAAVDRLIGHAAPRAIEVDEPLCLDDVG